MNILQINLLVSEVILNQTGEFDSDDIYNYLLETSKTIIEETEDFKDFIERKIKALWDANILTSTGFSYYVNN